MPSEMRDVPAGMEVATGDGPVVRIQAVAENIVRVRVSSDGRFVDSPLNRYGFILLDADPSAGRTDQDEKACWLKTPRMCVRVDRQTGRLDLLDADGSVLTRTAESSSRASGEGFRLSLELSAGEHLLGLGDQTRHRIDLRGSKADMWIRNVVRYIPIPFLHSSRGYGLMVNTTRRHRWDIGATETDRLTIEADAGDLDVYFMAGDTLGVLDAYTNLTGKPILPPKWSFGMWFICRSYANDHEVMCDAHTLRRESFPCDVIGLEPGWMGKIYDYSTDKWWDEDRFPMTRGRISNASFIAALKRMGFHLELWLCNGYDLSFEEERQVKVAAAAAGDAAPQQKDEVWDVEFEDKRLVTGEIHLDKVTKPDEPWFEHLKEFVDQGAELFKQDGADQTMEHPDRLWGNGMTDAEMHNLYPLLYAKQMHAGYSEHTGKRACIFTPNGWAGLQRYAGTWTGDTGGQNQTLVANMNLGLCAVSWTTCDMDNTTPEGIHFGFLQPWAQVNSFAYFKHPWLQGEKLCDMFRAYSHLRMRMIPYLYSCARISNQTGVPILRALPIEFPDDERGYEVLHEYMLGPAFLSAVFENRVYFPPGRWLDYWTGEVHEGPGEIDYQPPEDRGGGLFLRDGSIVPWGPLTQYVDEVPADHLSVEVFCSAGNSAEPACRSGRPLTAAVKGRFVLYEDDGATYAYENGAFATTRMSAENDGGVLRVRIGPTEGDYEGVIRLRRYELIVRDAGEVSEVTVDGQAIGTSAGEGVEEFYAHDQATRTLRVSLDRRARETAEVVVR